MNSTECFGKWGWGVLSAILLTGCPQTVSPSPTAKPMSSSPAPTAKTKGRDAVPKATASLSVEQAHEAWSPLLRENKGADAIALCRGWLRTQTDAVKVEAYKCLANASLSMSETIQIQADDTGGGTLGPGADPELATQAIGYLEKAILLDPQDLSLHQGRLHILMISGDYGGTTAALRDSIERYKGADALDAWLAYSLRFDSKRQYRAGIQFLHVLEEKYPGDHRVIANLGAFHGLLEEDDKALEYAKKAVEIDPQDPLNNWNLGRLYDFMGKVKKADKYYSRSLELSPNLAQVQDSYCLYADFVQEKLRNGAKACRLRKKHCPRDYESRCRGAAR